MNRFIKYPKYLLLIIAFAVLCMINGSTVYGDEDTNLKEDDWLIKCDENGEYNDKTPVEGLQIELQYDTTGEYYPEGVEIGIFKNDEDEPIKKTNIVKASKIKLNLVNNGILNTPYLYGDDIFYKVKYKAHYGTMNDNYINYVTEWEDINYFKVYRNFAPIIKLKDGEEDRKEAHYKDTGLFNIEISDDNELDTLTYSFTAGSSFGSNEYSLLIQNATGNLAGEQIHNIPLSIDTSKLDYSKLIWNADKQRKQVDIYLQGKVTDDLGKENTLNFVLTVYNNDPEALINVNNIYGNVDIEVPVTVKDLDGDAVTVEIKIDNGEWVVINTVTGDNWKDGKEFVYNIKKEDTGPIGSHTNKTIYVSVTDNRIPTPIIVQKTIMIDKKAPNLTLVQTPTKGTWTNGKLITTEVTITATANDEGGIGVKEIVLPDGTVKSGSEVIYVVTENGEYTFKAVDLAGNETEEKIYVEDIANPLDQDINIPDDLWPSKDVIDPDFDYDPDNMEGKTVLIDGKYYILTRNKKATIGNTTEKKIENAFQYSVNTNNVGFNAWYDMKEDGTFSHTVLFNPAGFYINQVRFRNEVGRESKSYAEINYLADWIKPEIEVSKKIPYQTATSGSFTVVVNAQDNISPYLYYSIDDGATWHKLPDGINEITFNDIDKSSSGILNNLVIKIGDLCGNVSEARFAIWGISN